MPAHGHPKGGVLAHPGNRPCTNIIAQVFAFVNPLSPYGDGRLGEAQKSALRTPRAPSGGGRGGGGSRGETDGYCRSYGVAPYLRCGRGTQRNSPGGATRQKAAVRPLAPPGRSRPPPKPEGQRLGVPAARTMAHRALRSFIARGACPSCNSRSNALGTVRGLPTAEHASAHNGGSFQAGGCRWGLGSGCAAPMRTACMPAGLASSSTHCGHKSGPNSRGTQAGPLGAHTAEHWWQLCCHQ